MGLKLLLIVLNKVELIDELLEDMAERGVKGATILKSTGMARELARIFDELPVFGSGRFQIDVEREESRTIFIVLKDEQIDWVRQSVKKVIGDISQPDTAVMFTLPVLSAEGMEL